MHDLDHLFKSNKRWAGELTRTDSAFFERTAQAQHPSYLWIGCSDSRVPADDIVGAQPGELFVHRNIANIVVHTDLSCLSVLQYAVDVLKVPHIIICGHYRCGGITAAMSAQPHGLIDNWLLEIKDLYRDHRDELDAIEDQAARIDRMCELNVVRQVENVAHTVIAQDAWRRGQALAVHGWIYNLQDGLLRDLELTITGSDAIDAVYRMHAGRGA
ncbi:MAG: carbonate dehydratase [Phycisphaerales bacterium]|nr:carbonate dehydratase [Phycisphaerales bacterium]